MKMPLVKREGDVEKTPEGEDKVEHTIAVTEPAPDDINEVIMRIMNILKIYNVERLEIDKDKLYFRHYPDKEVEETIKWFMNLEEE